MKKNYINNILKICLVGLLGLFSINSILNASNIKIIQDMTKYPLSSDKVSVSITPILIKN